MHRGGLEHSFRVINSFFVHGKKSLSNQPLDNNRLELIIVVINTLSRLLMEIAIFSAR